ncbi:MAG TPA: FAD-binding protein, partial [Patescibacteria group bacterium]|nr:FAD-binding protein [Patescibacteria group bacterium]
EQKIGRSIGQHEYADYYLEIEKVDDLVKTVRAAREVGIPVVVTGDARSLFEKGEKIAGLIIKNNCRKFDTMSMRGKISAQGLGVSEVLVQAESGTPMNQLVRFTIEEGLMGLEYQLGLPGTVGDALLANAGYKREKVRDSLHAVQVITREGSIMTYMENFAMHLEQEILLTAIFHMIPASKKALWERGQEAVEYRNRV